MPAGKRESPMQRMQAYEYKLEIMQLLAEKQHCNVMALKHYDIQGTVCFFVMEKYTCLLADWRVGAAQARLAVKNEAVHLPARERLCTHPRHGYLSVRMTRPLITIPFSSCSPVSTRLRPKPGLFIAELKKK